MPTNALPLANEPSLRSLFNEFSASDSALGAVSAYYALCAGVFLGPPPDPPDFFPALRDALLPILPYKHKALIDSLDARWTRCSVLRDKGGQRRKTSLIVSGAGPCGLRAAVESLLLGIPTLVLDLRTDFSRHNVLKTWQGTVDDLVSLGLATFLPGFKRHGTLHCATKEIQNCLLKAALLLGADVKFGVGVCGILDPSCVLNVGDEGASAAPGQWRVWTLPEQSARAFLRTVASRTEARNDREADNPAESKDSEPAELSLKPGEQDVSRLKQTSKVDYLESPVPDPLAVLSSNDLHSLPANAPESGLFDDSGIRTGTGTEIRLFPFSSLIIAEGESSRLIRRLGFSRKVSRFANAIGIVVNLDILPGSPKIAEFVAWRTLANWRSTALGPLSNLGIQLENLEYLRGNTHFIAATTRIPDLLSLGVVRDDLGTVRSTLSASNLDFEALRKLARTIATTVGIPDSAPLSSQHGVQIFDFSARGLCARLSSRLSPTGPPVMPAGDALQNPYWPQGLGINRGFHNAMDAVWSVFLDSIDPSEAEAERSDAFRTMDYLTFTPSCLAPADKWTADPTSRYAFEVYRRRRMEDVELGRETMLRRVREKLGL